MVHFLLTFCYQKWGFTESDERVSRLANAAKHYGGSILLHKINQDDYKEPVFYHSQCVIQYLMYLKDEQVNEYSASGSDSSAAFSEIFTYINDDLLKKSIYNPF